MQRIAVPLLVQLVVGRAGDNVDLEQRYGVVVDDGSQRTGSKDVRIDRIDVVRCHSRRAEFVNHLLHLPVVDVANHELGTFLVEMLAEVVADVPASLHGHRLPRQRIAPIGDLCARLHPAVYAEGGHR